MLARHARGQAHDELTACSSPYPAPVRLLLLALHRFSLASDSSIQHEYLRRMLGIPVGATDTPLAKQPTKTSERQQRTRGEKGTKQKRSGSTTLNDSEYMEEEESHSYNRKRNEQAPTQKKRKGGQEEEEQVVSHGAGTGDSSREASAGKKKKKRHSSRARRVEESVLPAPNHLARAHRRMPHS